MKRAIIVAGLLMFMFPRFALAQNRLFVGTWKADVANSRYQPGQGPRSETLRFEPVGEGFKVSFDGVDVPVVATPAQQGVVTYAFSRIDDRTWDVVIKVNREPRILVHNVVSRDGKTMRAVSTVTSRGEINQDVIFRKQ